MYTTELQTPPGLLKISCGEQGVESIRFIEKTKIKFFDAHPVLKEAAAQLQAYFSGTLKTFDLPLSPHGTEFQIKVWTALADIPFGKTVTYKQIAEKIGNPNAMRAVGMANNRNPLPIILPCHRVIGANGNLTGYAGGLHRKAWLLKHEGITL